MRRLSVMVSMLLLVVVGLGQQLPHPMTDQDVIEMVSLGLSDDLIIDKIKATEAADFDTSLAGLKALKLGKVSDAVIRVMIHVMINPPASTASAGSSSTTAANIGLTEDTGVYVVLKGKAMEIEPEVVNWQTGGAAKSHATLFILKGDVNGKVMKPTSPTQVRAPLEFLIKTVEGTSAAEYQLLRLHQKSDRREFRSVTGGVLHQSGGAQRDEVPFQPEKIGNRSWRVRLDRLPVGEYGFLAPGTSSVSISASGKMYTFGVLEGDRETNKGISSANERQTDTGIGSGGTASSPVFSDATIGASTDENPKTRHDGITLTRITPGGPAEQAGIRVGDVILAIDDHYLFTAEELDTEIKHHQPGTRVAVRYRRYSMIYATSLVMGSTR
jgi:PDZ domain-containing protein